MRAPRAFGALLLLLFLIPAPAFPAEEAPDETRAGRAEGRLSGRILLKDGVTAVAGAELILTDPAGRQVTARSGRRGRFGLDLSAGEYQLQVRRGTEIYRSPSLYRVAPDVRARVDFLIVRDFEPAGGPADPPISARRGPDPRPESPVEVGTVVDVVRATEGSGRRRWLEVLGFMGSLLAVAVASL